MKIKHIAWIRLASGWSAQQQRDLAVRPRVLAQIVIDDQRVFAFPHEILAHRTAGKRRQIPQRRRVLGRNGHDDGVLHRAFLLEDVHDFGDRRRLLPDGDVDTRQVAAALIDDRVQRNRRLARLAVADDQLALAAADRDHRVDGFDARLDGRVDRRTQHDARCDDLDRPRGHVGWQRALTVERLAQRVHHATDQLRTDRDRGDAPGAAHLVAFFDVRVRPDDHDADRFFFEVQSDAHDLLFGELDQLERADIAEAIHARDTVTHLDHRANLTRLDGRGEVCDLLDKDGVDFFGWRCHLGRFAPLPSQGLSQALDSPTHTIVDYLIADPRDHPTDA